MSDSKSPRSNGVPTPNGQPTTPTRGIVRQPVPAPEAPVQIQVPVPVTAAAPVPVPQQLPQEAAPVVPLVPAMEMELPTDMEQEVPIVRMRNGTSVINGQQQQANGHAAIQRGLEMLAEQEMDQNMEEIKKLDTQLDHFNKYLDTFEKKNNELTERLETMLKSQREERLKRRSSFMQREEEHKAEQNSLDSQINSMLSRCAQSRRTSVPVFAGSVEQSIDQQRRRASPPDDQSGGKSDDKMDTQ